MSKMAVEITDKNNQSLSNFISTSPWDERPLIDQIGRDVVELLYNENAESSLIVDESGFVKQGKKSVGVSRQYCGTLGKVENCQVGVFLGYCSEDLDSTIIDKRLYLPESWCEDADRCRKAGVPDYAMIFKTKAELAFEMIISAKVRNIPFNFVSMDGFYGEQPWLLSALDQENIVYMADIPCSTRVYLEYPEIGIGQRQGERGKHPSKVKVLEGDPVKVQDLITSEKLIWKEVEIRDTQRGKLKVRMAGLKVWRIENELPVDRSVTLLIRQELDGSGTKYSICNSCEDLSIETLSDWQSRRYWIERSFEDAKGLAGMGDYMVTGWRGWHHHMTMIMLAMLFLLELKKDMSHKAPMFSLQDAKRILEQVLPKKVLTHEESLKIICDHHNNRHRSRESRLKKQKKKAKD